MASITAVGDPLQPDDANYGWRKLNDLLDLLKTNRLMFFRRQTVGPFTVTSGQGDITGAGSGNPAPITIGNGATWNTPRPVWIDKAGVIYTAGGIPQPELPIRVFTVKQWADIVVKGIQSTLSRALIYDQSFGTTGFGNIYLYPVPSASFQVVLYVPEAIDEFATDAAGNPDFTIVISMPPGYRAMLISQLAMILSLGLVEITQDLKDYAAKAMAYVQSSNIVQMADPLSCDEATLGREERASGWDFISGGFN